MSNVSTDVESETSSIDGYSGFNRQCSGSGIDEEATQLPQDTISSDDGSASSTYNANRASPLAPRILSFAARSVRSRLENALGIPSWVSYLTPELHATMWLVDGAEQHSCNGNGNADAVAELKFRERVWNLSKCPHGCREVQLAFDNSVCDDALSELASGLRGHVWEALLCPHANHVLQKCISTMKPQALQFIIDEIMSTIDGPSKAAQHRYGCRVIRRLIKHCAGEQARGLVESILADARKLAVHDRGNFVIQQLLESSMDEHVGRLMQLVEQDVVDLALDPYGSTVLTKVLSMECAGDRVGITRAVLQVPGLLAKMSAVRHAYVGVKAILGRPGAEQKFALAQLTAEIDSLSSTRYGKIIKARLTRSGQPTMNLKSSSAV